MLKSTKTKKAKWNAKGDKLDFVIIAGKPTIIVEYLY